MNKSKSKFLTIFLCVILAFLFALAICFTIIKNDMKAKERYYNEQNKDIEKQIEND